MDEKILESLLSEKDRIESTISEELAEKDIREIQSEELELLNKILQQLKKKSLLMILRGKKIIYFIQFLYLIITLDFILHYWVLDLL